MLHKNECSIDRSNAFNLHNQFISFAVHVNNFNA